MKHELAAKFFQSVTTFVLLAIFCAPAGAADTGYVFVSHERSHTVVVLDPANDHEVVKEIATSRRPRDMRFDDAQALLYVACGDDDMIDIINIEKLEVVDQIPTGRSPEVFDIAADQKSLYVSEEESAIVRQIDIETHQTLQEIPTGPEPEGVLVTEDGSTVYFTSEVADLVHVVDTSVGKVVENILVGIRPRRFAMNSDGSELWVTDELGGQVSVIDTESNEVTTTVQFLPPGFRKSDVTPVGIALARDGGTMYVALGRANHVAYVDPETKAVEAYVLVGSRAWGIAPNASDTLLYVANGLSDDISVVDIPAQKTIRSIATGRVPHTVVVDD